MDWRFAYADETKRTAVLASREDHCLPNPLWAPAPPRVRDDIERTVRPRRQMARRGPGARAREQNRRFLAEALGSTRAGPLALLPPRPLTVARAQGPVVFVSRQLGHANPTVTLSTCAHRSRGLTTRRPRGRRSKQAMRRRSGRVPTAYRRGETTAVVQVGCSLPPRLVRHAEHVSSVRASRACEPGSPRGRIRRTGSRRSSG